MSERVLSLSLRPRSLSHLFGQEATVKAIRSHVAKRPPQTWMFHGPTGTGKTTIARIMSVAYQCDHMKLWGDPCDACWKRASDFAIHEINASDVSGVDELGKVARLSRFKPSGSSKRVIILDEAQKISTAAMNLLLKPLEEPPETTVWIICTSEPSKILQTIRRRCVIFPMKSLGISGAEDFLKKQAARAGITRDLGPLFEQCHLSQVGAPAVLLQALEKYAAGSSAAESVTGADESGIDSLRVCKAVTSGKWQELSAALKEASPDQARLIRASVAGWLKGCMARATATPEIDRAATSLLELCQPPLDDATMMHWLWGTLWKISKRYREAGR